MGLTNNLGKLSNMITSTGSAVGIAQASPAYTLDVSGTGRFTGALSGTSATFINSLTTGAFIKSSVASGGSVITAESTATNGEGQFVVLGKNSGGTIRSGSFKYDNADILRIGTSSNIGFQFETNDVARMRITSGGVSVFGYTAAVGTNFSPPVQVKGGAGTGNGYAIISGNNEIAGGIQLTSSGSNSLQITCDPDNLRASSEIAFSIDGSQKMAITSGGVVQIAGLTSNGTVSTQSSNGSLYVSSDANLKIEDGYIENGLEKVLALKPRYFYWKDTKEFSADRQLGFYAQEVNAVSEETANTPPEGCGWGIYDRGLVALLTSAIQEMNTKFEEQQATITSLQDRLTKAGL